MFSCVVLAALHPSFRLDGLRSNEKVENQNVETDNVDNDNINWLIIETNVLKDQSG